MLTRLETIRRRMWASACWSTFASLAVLGQSFAIGADRNPAPRKLWAPLNGRPSSSDPSRFGKKAVEPPKEVDPQAENQAEINEPGRIKLNFVSSPWPKVLEDVAKQSNSKLVMMDEPSTRFSRQDWSGRYTRTEAVRILNRDLEPQGYRLLEKNEFLTLINVHRQDLEYQRPMVAAGEPAAPPRKLPGATDTGVQHALAQNTGRNLVQRAAHEDGEEGQIAPAATAKPISRVSVSKTFEPMHRSALDLSKQVLRAFEPMKRTEFVNEGPGGLPGFQVYAAGPEDSTEHGPLLFVVELDADRDQIGLHGADDVVDRMLKVLAKLDGLAATKDGKSVQLIPSDDRAADIAARVRPVVKQLAQFQQGALGAGNSTRDDAPDAPPMPPAKPGDNQDVIDSPQNDVTIEVFEGNIILRGPAKDVEAVTRMIRAIEAAAAGSLPEVHLVLLQNADAKSLAALVENVYTQLATLRNRGGNNNNQKQVTAIAVVQPNALLLLAPQTQLEAAMDVVKKLDVPVAPGMQMQVFGLKAAVATQVLTQITTLFPTTDTTGLAPTATAVADIRTNSLVVMARPRDMKTIVDLVDKLDRDSSNVVILQKQFKLKFAIASEMATFLQQAIQSALNPPATATGGTGGQAAPVAGGGASTGPAELKTPKASVLEFLFSDGNAERFVRSGILSDVRIVAEPRTNSLLISAPEGSLPLLSELIHVLDQPSASVSEFKVITLENADAVSAVTLLNELFGQANQTNQQGQATNGIQLQGAQEAASSLIPLQFAADARTNSVIASGGPAAMQLVEAILSRLDSSDSRNRQTEVIRLRNVSAQDVSTALTTFLQQIRDLSQLDPERVTTNQLLLQEIIVAPELSTNNLLVSATPRYMKDVLRIINQLDREPDQVMIQGIIVQVALTGNCEFGVELGFQNDILFNRSSPTTGLPGFLFNSTGNLGNNTAAANPQTVGGQGLSNFNLGRTSTDAGFGGLVLGASSDAVSVLIRALEANSNAQILSRPQILAVDNQIAEITVGQLVPRSSSVSVTTLGNAFPIFTDKDVGIILSVIPRITPEGKIIMDIIANKSELSSQTVTIFVNSDGSTVTSPIINQSRAQTTVKVPDGQTIVVGGMITSSDTATTRKVPWLGDLPVIGHAFRYDKNINTRSELIIFLTPRVLRRDLDQEIIKQVEAERLNFFETDVEAMHGPLFGVPRPDWTPGCPPDGVPTAPGGKTPAVLPPGSIMPDGQTPTGPNMPSLQLDYVPQGPASMVEPGTNSRRVRGEYGEAFGRRPLAH